MRASLRTWALLAVLALIVMSFAACGGDGESSDGGSTGADTSAAGGDLDEVSAEIEEWKAIPEFEPPGEPFDARAAVEGKKVLSIPASSAVPFVQRIQERMIEIADEIGLEIIDWPNQGSPDQWAQGMNAAISQDVDLINLLAGIDPAALGPQIDAADEAGIPTVVSHLYDVDQERPDNVFTVDIPYKQGGRLLADWVIQETGGDTHTLVVTIKEVLATVPLVAGIEEQFDTYCPDCKLTFVDVTIPEIATRIQPQVQSALSANPDINYVIALYDSAQAPFAVAGIRAAGAQDRVKVATFNGTPDVLKMVQDEDIVAVDIGENLDWIAHGIMDQMMRILAGLEPVDDPNIPLRVFDDTNIDDTGTPPELSTGYGDSYVQGYRDLWQLDE